jgi:hypothetical protein
MYMHAGSLKCVDTFSGLPEASMKCEAESEIGVFRLQTS